MRLGTSWSRVMLSQTTRASFVPHSYGFVLTRRLLGQTVMPEALEKWPVPLLQDMLPRILQIIFDSMSNGLYRRILSDAKFQSTCSTCKPSRSVGLAISRASAG